LKTIIAGSRGITSLSLIEKAIEESGITITEVVSGTARGVDTLGEEWAQQRGIPVKRFPAKWDTFGRAAGYKRNVDMAEYGEVLIALWDSVSKGTKHMIDIAKAKGLKVYVFKTSN